ncbi:MAG: cobalt ECF transporter T component CbiQ [Caulobacteraceae bacterium]
MTAVDRLAHRNAWSRRHPADKLVLAGGLLLLSIALPPLPGAALVLASALGAAILGARVPPADLARLMAVPAAFILSGALVLAIAPAGALTAVDVSLRATAASASLLLLMTTTPISDLLGLLRAARIPAPLVDVVLLVYRFIMLVIGGAEAIRTAQTSRLGYTSLRRSIRSVGLLAAALLPRSLDRGRRLEIGLAARAYDGNLCVLGSAPPPSAAFLVTAIGLQAGLAAISILLWRGLPLT